MFIPWMLVAKYFREICYSLLRDTIYIRLDMLLAIMYVLQFVWINYAYIEIYLTEIRIS